MTDHINIYKITNIINNKCYIGQTCHNILKRFKEHLYSSKRNKSNTLLSKAIRKNGIDSFRIDVILKCNHDMANYYEHEVMNLYNAHYLEGGYNVAMPLDHFRSIASVKGEKHHGAKLNDNNILDIRKSFNLSSGDIAKKYNVSTSVIKKIRSGKSWKHVIGEIYDQSKYIKNRAKGESHHNSIFNDEIRALIRNDYYTNTSDLAKKYNTTSDLISSIRGAKPNIARKRVITNDVAQYVLDNPHLKNSELHKILNISIATISRIKTRKQFSHLISNASIDLWEKYYSRNTKLK